MASFIGRIRGAAKGPGQANGPEHAPAKPGPLSTGRLIGAGGEGAVYEDRNDPHMVIKVLHQQHATPERSAKLQAMCNNPPQNAQELSWPDVVETDASGLRYRMPKASGRAGTAYRFISANERRQLPPRQQEYEYRTKIGVKIAEAFRWLHAIHVRIGDVNPSNILVSDDGSVMLIDCDSFQIPGPPGRQPYPCVVGSPEYTAPEIDDFRRQFRSQDSDNFALAVLLYQLLSNGSHPYQGIDASADDAVSNIRERIKEHRFAHQPREGLWRPTPGQVRSWRAMPEPVRNAFRQAFSPDASHIGRPTADAWASILEQNPSPTPVGEQQSAQPSPKASVAPPAWQVGPQPVPRLQSAPSPVVQPIHWGTEQQMQRLLRLLVAAVVITAAAGFAWLVYGETETSAAVRFDESIGMVHHQTDRMSETLGDTGAFVNANIAAAPAEKQVSEITSISELIDEWEPRYNETQTVYLKFDSAIVAAEQRAEEYFASQRALTGRYNDPEKRAQAQEYDDEDYGLYGEWRTQAHRARSHAQEIMSKLDDIDTDLRKLQLSSEFSSNGGTSREVPQAILLLDEELAEFQLASENIREIMASPVEVQ